MFNLPGYVKASAKAVPGCGIVQLDQEYQGRKYASINPTTKGRDLLSKDRDGHLVVGCRVVVLDAEVMSKALYVKEIARE